MTTNAPGAAVLVKSVPIGGRFLRIENGRLSREGVAHGLDPINEVCIEWALQARSLGTLSRVSAIAMGPDLAADSLRRALAMGCDDAMLIADPKLSGAGVRLTAQALAAAVHRAGVGLALFGNESLDGSSGTVPSAVATILDWPLLSLARTATIKNGTLRGSRDMGAGAEVAEVELPAVVSFVAGGVDPHYPKLKEIFTARKAPLAKIGLNDLSVNAAEFPPGERVIGLVEAPESARRVTRVMNAEEGVDELIHLLESVGPKSG